MQVRRTRLYQNIARQKLDGFLVSKQENIFYLSGFTGEDALLLMLRDKGVLFIDARFQEQAEKELPRAIKAKISNKPFTALALYIKRRGLKRIGFEEEWLSCFRHRILKDKTDKTKLVSKQGMVEQLRLRKFPAEIALLRKAVGIASSSLDKIAGFLKPGRTEIEIAAELERLMNAAGARACAFDTIVASGRRSSLPHARPTQRKLKAGEAVLIDAGAVYKNYNSDLTRMFSVGRMNRKVKERIDIVTQAQEAAISQIVPGVQASALDRTARNVLRKAGLGKYFLHALGHGVGLEVHENPPISSRNDLPLEEGMIFTVEPAVYIPGWGGVRLEKMVRVTRGGYEVL